jgi:hypothetical protein
MLATLQVSSAGFGQMRAARSSMQQPHTEMFLELDQRARDGGQRPVRSARRGREAAGLGDAHESPDGEQMVH